MKKRVSGQKIQDYILHHLDENPTDILNATAHQFSVPHHQVKRQIRHLLNNGIIESMGLGDAPYYTLRIFHNKELRLFLDDNNSQALSIWRNEIEPMLTELPGNVLTIWQYGFKAILENAESHANANSVLINLKKTSLTVEISLLDDGDGIFHCLCRKLHLPDETCVVSHFPEQQTEASTITHAPSIKRAIQAFDQLVILSGQTWLSYKRDKKSPLNGKVTCQVERAGLNKGTLISMKLFNDAQHCLAENY